MLIVMIHKQEFIFYSFFFLLEMGLVSFYYELWKVCLVMAENSYDMPFSPQVMKIYFKSCDSQRHW